MEEEEQEEEKEAERQPENAMAMQSEDGYHYMLGKIHGVCSADTHTS